MALYKQNPTPATVLFSRPLRQLRRPLPRGLAIAQQVKDTITIAVLLSNGLLLFGILFGVGVPGLIMYVLRWKQVGRYGGQGRSLGLWVLSLVHELVWAVVFFANSPAEPLFTKEMIGCLAGGYMIGFVICLVALLDLMTSQAEEPSAD